MQKKLIALAVAGVFAAPAFAATSNVDIYGKFHASMNFYNDQPDEIDSFGFSSNASRVGLKGAEDLGGGLSAIWQIESTVNLDEGGGWGSGRNTFVGLKGDWGTVLGGKHDTPLKLVGRSVDLFGDTIADSRNVLGGGSDTRADNVIAYLSPDFTGFSFAAAYTTDLLVSIVSGPFIGSAGVGSGDRDDAEAYNLMAQYKNGPIYVGVGYGDGNAHENLGYGAHWRVAGAFDMGNFRFVAQYDDLSEDGNSLGDFDAWLVGAQYKMGAWVFKGNYMDGEYDSSSYGYDVDQWTVGVDYNLSKRTTVYALYVDGTNIKLGSGAGASDVVGSGYTAPTYSGGGTLATKGKDNDMSAFSIGITHTF